MQFFTNYKKNKSMVDLDFLKTIFEYNKKIKNFSIKERSEFFVKKLFNILFIPNYKNRKSFINYYKKLRIILYKILIELNFSQKNSNIISKNFFKKIPNIYNLLIIDAKSILESDPAANSIDEIFLTYPGFFSIALYRIANQLWDQGVSIIPRIITEYAHSKTGIDIHFSAIIGSAFAIDHGTGIVIGSSTKIGNQVRIYQGVTLGAINVDKKFYNKKRHPTIEDRVIIYSGATILGGKTVIGHDSVLGGNVWITKSIPPFSIVYQKSEIKMRNKNNINNPINFMI